MNNLKRIREIYGATQERVARAIGVNRVTLANWEIGTSVASETSREKLSLFYGIGPEYFYDKKLDTVIETMILDSSKKEKLVTQQSGGKRNKAYELNNLLGKRSFTDSMQRYMLAMKLLLATADNGSLEDLKIALQINQKMGARLDAIIAIREEEEEKKKSDNEATLNELIGRFVADE